MAVKIRYAPTKRLPRSPEGLAHAKKIAQHVEAIKASDDFQRRAEIAMAGHATRKAQHARHSRAR